MPKTNENYKKVLRLASEKLADLGDFCPHLDDDYACRNNCPKCIEQYFLKAVKGK